MAENKKPGKIITFYSYKGGTGRSMALANVAWILASNGKRVLAIDWDLEAPGLHRYFSPFLADKELTSSDGLINFVDDYRVKAMSPPAKGEQDSKYWYIAYADISDYAVAIRWEFQGGGKLDLVPAGKQDDSYSQLFNLFNWQDFYTPLGGGKFLDVVKEGMRKDYDYILIDSRTGVSDTSGICTIRMPDMLVVCFTLNNQGIEGAARVADSVSKHRPDLKIFPVPMRIDNGELEKLGLRTEYAKKKFSRFPNSLSENVTWEQYWAEIPFLYVTYYAYEEVLAVFGPSTGNYASMLASAERLTSRLTGGEVSKLVPPPKDKRLDVLRLYEGKVVSASPMEQVAGDAEKELARMSDEQRAEAKRLFLRLVYVVPRDESGGNEAKPLRVGLKSLTDSAQAVAQQLAETRLLSLERVKDGEDLTVGFSNDEFLRNWSWLRDLVEENRVFLLWRQRLGASLANWELTRHDKTELLRGRMLDEARTYLLFRPGDLSSSEQSYIRESIAATESWRNRQRRFGMALAIVGLLISAYSIYVGVSSLRERKRNAEAAAKLAAAADTLDPQSDPQLKVLLATESLKLASSPKAEEILRSELPLLPVRGDSLHHDGVVYQVVFGPDGKEVIGLLRLVKAGLSPSDNPGRNRTALPLAPPQSQLDLSEWDTGGTDQTSTLVNGNLSNLSVSPNGQYVSYINMSESGPPPGYDIHVMEVSSKASALSVQLKGRVLETAFSDDGSLFAVAHGSAVLIWRMKATSGSSPLVLKHAADVYSLAFSQHGKYIATGSDDYKVQVWDTETGLKVNEGWKLNDTAYKIAFGNPDGATPFADAPFAPLLTLAENSKTINIWNWRSNNPQGDLRTTVIYDSAVNDFALSPDNFLLAASCGTGLVLIGTSNGTDTLDASALRPDFSADGKYLVGVGGKVVKVWELGGMRRVINVISNGVVSDAAFAPVGELLVTGSTDGTERLWNLKSDLSDDLIKESCSRLTRNLSQQEWQKYISGEYRRTCSDLP